MARKNPSLVSGQELLAGFYMGRNGKESIFSPPEAAGIGPLNRKRKREGKKTTTLHYFPKT